MSDYPRNYNPNRFEKQRIKRFNSGNNNANNMSSNSNNSSSSSLASSSYSQTAINPFNPRRNSHSHSHSHQPYNSVNPNTIPLTSSSSNAPPPPPPPGASSAPFGSSQTDSLNSYPSYSSSGYHRPQREPKEYGQIRRNNSYRGNQPPSRHNSSSSVNSNPSSINSVPGSAGSQGSNGPPYYGRNGLISNQSGPGSSSEIPLANGIEPPLSVPPYGNNRRNPSFSSSRMNGPQGPPLPPPSHRDPYGPRSHRVGSAHYRDRERDMTEYEYGPAGMGPVSGPGSAGPPGYEGEMIDDYNGKPYSSSYHGSRYGRDYPSKRERERDYYGGGGYYGSRHDRDRSERYPPPPPPPSSYNSNNPGFKSSVNHIPISNNKLKKERDIEIKQEKEISRDKGRESKVDLEQKDKSSLNTPTREQQQKDDGEFNKDHKDKKGNENDEGDELTHTQPGKKVKGLVESFSESALKPSKVHAKVSDQPPLESSVEPNSNESDNENDNDDNDNVNDNMDIDNTNAKDEEIDKKLLVDASIEAMDVDKAVNDDIVKLEDVKKEADNKLQNDLSVVVAEPQLEEEEEEEEQQEEIINGCIFPMTKVETNFWDLKHKRKSEIRKHLKYLPKSEEQKINDFKQYNFYKSSILIFKQADGPRLASQLLAIKDIVKDKNSQLVKEYLSRKQLHKKRAEIIEKQLTKFHSDSNSNQLNKAKSNDDSNGRSNSSNNDSGKNNDSNNNDGDNHGLDSLSSKPASTTRRGRHHGDSVRTEAEFMEILASLEKESEKNPIVKAQHGAANIPNMILNPIDKHELISRIDTNNLVRNKEAWAERITTDPIDTFTTAEHEKFCEAYAMWPKKFGRIANYLGGLRTTEECVLHYYKTKKETNFKHIVSTRNRRTTRKAAANRKKGGSNNNLNNSVTVNKSRNGTQTPDENSYSSTPEVNNSGAATAEGAAPNTENEVESEQLYTDTGRRKRAAAPTSFDAKKQRIEQAEEDTALTADSKKKQKRKSNSEEVKKELSSTQDLKSEIKFVHLAPPSQKEEQQEQAEQQHGQADTQRQEQQQIQQQPEPQQHGQSDYSSALPHPEGPNFSTATQVLPQATSLEDFSKKLKDTSSQKRGHISSYWSGSEKQLFPTLLKKYGSNWERVVKELNTKTSTMIRNHYQRGLIDNPHWEQLVRDADSNNNYNSTLTPVTQNDHPSVNQALNTMMGAKPAGHSPSATNATVTPSSASPSLSTPGNPIVSAPYQTMSNAQYPGQSIPLPSSVYPYSSQLGPPMGRFYENRLNPQDTSTNTATVEAASALANIPSLSSLTNKFASTTGNPVSAGMFARPMDSSSGSPPYVSSILNPSSSGYPPSAASSASSGGNTSMKMSSLLNSNSVQAPHQSHFMPPPLSGLPNISSGMSSMPLQNMGMMGMVPSIGHQLNIGQPQLQPPKLRTSSIMNLLNNDSDSTNKSGPSSYQSHSQSPPLPPLTQSLQPQAQQPPLQQQQAQQPASQQGRTLAGLSALDALAQIAFERK